MRTARPQTIETRRPRLADRIVGGFLAPAPSVKNDQHDRTALLPLPTSSAPRRRWRSAPTGIHRPRELVWDRDAIVNQRLVLRPIGIVLLVSHGGDFCSVAASNRAASSQFDLV